ncbi:unnamed protein product, partial [Effrenium voratum]
GGFVEHDDANRCLWTLDTGALSCWDDSSLQLRFRVGLQDFPSIPLFLHCLGSAALVTASDSLHVTLYSAETGQTSAAQVLLFGTSALQLADLVTDQVLLCKRQHSAAVLVDLASERQICRLHGTEEWTPEEMCFIPQQRLFLVRFAAKLELWRYFLEGDAQCWLSREIDAVGELHKRVCINSMLASILFPRAMGCGEDLQVLDLTRNGNSFCILHGVYGGFGGGVILMQADLAAGVLLVLGADGDLACYAFASC